MGRKPSRLPRIAAAPLKKKSFAHPPSDEHIRRAKAAPTADKISEDTCSVCGETVVLDSDGFGHLAAYDRATWKVHRHPEAAFGQWEPPPPPPLPPPEAPPARYTPEQVMDILESDDTARELAERYECTLSYIYAIRGGRALKQPGYDYEDGKARRAARAIERGAKATRETGDRSHPWTETRKPPMQRLQV